LSHWNVNTSEKYPIVGAVCRSKTATRN